MASPGDVVEITVLKSQPDSDKALELLRKIASVSSPSYYFQLWAIGGRSTDPLPSSFKIVRSLNLSNSTIRFALCLSIESETYHESSRMDPSHSRRVLSKEPKPTR